jgi:hypothetical protein
MKWIIDDIREAWAELKRWETWLTIGLLLAFSVLTYLIIRFAFRTDAILSHLGLAGGFCMAMSNQAIIAIFSGMIFFALTATLTLGETQQFFQARKKGAEQKAQKALRGAILWGVVAVSIAIGALTYFNMNCY